MDNSLSNFGDDGDIANNQNQHEDYDNDYPPLEASGSTSTIQFTASKAVPKNSAKKISTNNINNCNIETKVIKFPAKNVPKNPDKFFSELKSNVSQINSQIIVTKLPCGSYNILVKAPREKIADAVALVERELQPRISKKIKFEPRRYAMLTAKGFELTKEILQDVTKDVHISSQQNNMLVITGVASDVAKALKLINRYMDKMSTSEVLTIDDIPQKFHPFVRGAFNCNLTKIIADCDNCISIDVPNPNNNSRAIVITGPEEYRLKAKNEIMKIYNNVKKNAIVKTFKVSVSYHANIKRACGLDKILKETNVAISLPYEGQVSDSVIFVGNSKDIPNAFHLALARARVYKYSEIPCKQWVLKMLKQKPSFSFADLKTAYPHVWVSYLPSKECIVLDGPVDDVNAIENQYTCEIEGIAKNMTFTSTKIPSYFFPYLNRDGSKIIGRICDATNTKVDFTDTQSSIISPDKPMDCQFVPLFIFGRADDVDEASKFFEEYITQLSESTIIEIEIDTLLLPYVIAECQSNSIHEELKKTFGSSLKVNVKSQKNKRKSTIHLQGKKGIALSAQSLLDDIINRVSDDIIIHDVHIPLAYHHLLFGKKGTVKEDIIESSGVEKIIFPTGNNTNNSNSDGVSCSTSNYITLVGSSKACKLAEILMTEKCNMDVELDQCDIKLSKSLVEKLRVGDGVILRRIISNCLGNIVIVEDNVRSNIVNVHLPPGELHSINNVRVHGHKSYIKLVIDKLLNYDKNNSLFVESITVDDGMMKSVIGKGGTQLRKFSEGTSVEIIAPSMRSKKTQVSSKSPDSGYHLSENVYLVGSNQSDLAKVKSQITRFVKELKDTVETTINIPKKYVKKFFAKKNDDESLISRLNTQYPSVRVTVPKDDDDGNSGNDEAVRSIILKGPSKIVTKIHSEIINLIKKWDSTVRAEFSLPYDHVNMLRNCEAPNFTSIGEEYDVTIRSFRDGDKTTKPTSETPVNVVIEGINKAVVAAKEKIMELGPATEKFSAPRQYHRSLIGAKGSELKKIIEGFNVNITFPESDNPSDDIFVRGPKLQLKPVLGRLKEALDSIIKRQHEWEKNNHIIELAIDSKWFSKLIGRGGKQIKSLKKQFNILINIPKPDSKSNLSHESNVLDLNSAEENSTNLDENGVQSVNSESKIVLRGEVKLCEQAQAKIEAMINEWENAVTVELQLPKSIHGKLRGFKSSNTIKIQKKYKVEIRFAPIEEQDNDIIRVSGQPQNVQHAIDYIKEMAAQFVIELDNDDEENCRIPNIIESLENFKFTTIQHEPGHVNADKPQSSLSRISSTNVPPYVEPAKELSVDPSNEEIASKQCGDQNEELCSDTNVTGSESYPIETKPPLMDNESHE